MICPTCTKNTVPSHILGTDMSVHPYCSHEGCGARLPDFSAESNSTPELVVKQAPKLVETTNVLDMAKSRLAVVDAEIEKLRSLEAEQCMLRRMINAAEAN